MKKNGKKYRKLQKEKLDRKKKHLEKCGPPYSKRKVKVCRHYGYNGEIRSYMTRWEIPHYQMIYTGAVSYLDPVSDEKCRCRCCGAEFPVESYHEMEHYVKNNCRVIDDIISTPHEWETVQRIEETGEPPVKPTRYCYVAKDQIEYISD